MIRRPPPLDTRNRQGVLEDLFRSLSGYTPEWMPQAQTSAAALMQVFARYMEILSEGLNQTPERNMLAFLEMMGSRLLPTQAARVPLVFQLSDSSPVDVALPAGSQVAAQAPILVTDSATPTDDALFATTQTIVLSRAQLKAVYSLDPDRDEYTDHTSTLTSGFTLFEDLHLAEHEIYLGHNTLFALAGDITVLLYFSFDAGSRRGLELTWEYMTDQGWLPLEAFAKDDTTQGLQQDGQIVLHRECGPNAKQDTFFGRTSFWIRGRMTAPFLPDDISGERPLPIVNDIRARIGIEKSGLLPDAAFVDSIPLDVSKDFYPFGEQPARYTTFYLTNKEVFQRKAARARLDITFSQPGRILSFPLGLAWEYFDGRMWSPLSVISNSNSKAFDFTKNGSVSFSCPEDWAETSVNGTKNYWMRVRLLTGDFGCPLRVNLDSGRQINSVGTQDGKVLLTLDSNEAYCGGDRVVLTTTTNVSQTFTVAYRSGNDKLVLEGAIQGNANFTDGTVAPDKPNGSASALFPSSEQLPVIQTLKLGFSYLTDSQPLNHCLSKNDFVFADHSEACRWPDETFSPLRPLRDRRPSVNFGFDQKLPVGLVSLYIDAAQEDKGEAVDEGSLFVWDYYSSRGWSELGTLDETSGFRQSGMIQFVGPPDAIAVAGLGGELYRLRARLKDGERLTTFSSERLWVNAVWAEQHTSFAQEDLGSSDGSPGQSLFFPRGPVLENEWIEIEEWRGKGELWKRITAGVSERDLRFERDPASGDIQAVWITWHSRPYLYHCGADDRCYEIDRATGRIHFGDGLRGRIPAAGSRVVATYNIGGGLSGNLPVGAISELRTVVPYLQSASNPVSSSGGAELETRPLALRRAPHRVRSLERAIAAEDYEWLAREASPEVALARCLPLTGSIGRAQRGWVTVVITPHSRDLQPQPTAELCRRVREYLVQRMPAAAGQVRLIAPEYTTVSVRAEILLRDPQEAAKVEIRLLQTLANFLHPLYGGTDGFGWGFGQPVYFSQIARVLQADPGVERVRSITLLSAGRVFDGSVEVADLALVSSGDHELKLVLREG